MNDLHNAVPQRERRAILAVRPDLAGVPLRTFGDGWDCLAVGAGETIFKFPRHAAAEARLRREPQAIALLAGRTALRLPTMTIHEVADDGGPVVFSAHDRVPGEILEPHSWAELSERERDRLADDVAAFFAACHAVPIDAAVAAGAAALRPRPSAREVAAAIVGRLPPNLAAVADFILVAHASLPPERAVFGQFDTHGWNMAYDRAARRLVGLFDFADAGVGPRHRDLSYPSFLSPDFAGRVARRVAAGGEAVDVTRLAIEHGFIRLADLAASDEPLPLAEAFGAWRAAARLAGAGLP